MPATLFGPEDSVDCPAISAEFCIDKPYIVRELTAVLLELCHRRIQLLRRLKFVLNFEPCFERREQVLLARLSRMDLEAEITELRAIEALLHNIQCRRLLCNK